MLRMSTAFCMVSLGGMGVLELCSSLILPSSVALCALIEDGEISR